jgi:AcrR family transcriptional regulator
VSTEPVDLDPVDADRPDPDRADMAGVALDGRALGKRGALTRRRLLDATARLLEDRGVRDLRVVDIAREVGTSPATFYQYFRDVEEAVLALSDEVGEDLAPLGELLGRDWSGPSGLECARELVDAFIAYWDAHRAILRTRNLAAQEGDQRFRAVRIESLRPLLEGLAAKVTEAQAVGRVDAGFTPIAAASALAAMMERMAAFHADLEPLGVGRSDLVETTARIVHQTVTGQTVTGQAVTG